MFPSEVTDIVEAMTQKYGSDITKATDDAVLAIQKLPVYESLVDTLVRNAIRDLIYDERHKSNVRTKRAEGYYGQTSKVTTASASTEKVLASVYDYYLAGKTLGEVQGKELEKIEADERSIAEGHVFNSKLCEWLRKQGVTGERRVKEVVKEGTLRKNFDRILKEVRKAA